MKNLGQVKTEIEMKMIESHGRIYKYRLYDEHRGTRKAVYSKGTIEIKVKMNVQEIREQKLKELGI